MMETALQLLHSPVFGTAAWLWLVFAGVVLTLLALDLGVLHKGDREIGVRESLVLSAGYIAASSAFGAWVWWQLGSQSGIDFFTGFLVEKSLSMDNVFVIAMVFGFFALPRAYQHRVLFWGILGVIVLRAIMIGLGAALIHQFSWVLYVFGAFLVITGVKMWFAAGQEPDITTNPVLKLLKKRIRITNHFDGEKLSTMVDGVKHYTPLFAVLVLIGTTDVIFAVDSIPAIFAITSDPFIVLTANIFAILGLRALYFLLADLANRFHLLAYGLALVLVFIGGKIFAGELIGKIPASISLGVTLALIAGGVIVSLIKTRHPPGADVQPA